MLTSDTLFNGKLIVYQRKGGYRFALDAVLLAGLTRVRPGDRILDLGTGCGVVPLVMAHRNQGQQIVGIEIQPDLVRLARQNVEANGFSSRIEIHEGEFRQVPPEFRPGSFDLATSNPPYRRLHSGRLNRDEEQAIARHELKASLTDVFRTAAMLLRQGGRLSVVYAAARLAHLLVTAHEYHLAPKQLTMIHSDAASRACLVHLECRKGAGEDLKVAPPFLIYREDRTYTEAMRRLYEDGQESQREIT